MHRSDVITGDRKCARGLNAEGRSIMSELQLPLSLSLSLSLSHTLSFTHSFTLSLKKSWETQGNLRAQ